MCWRWRTKLAQGSATGTLRGTIVPRSSSVVRRRRQAVSATDAPRARCALNRSRGVSAGQSEFAALDHVSVALVRLLVPAVHLR